MRQNTETVVRCAVALQVAALEFDRDSSGEQSEAYQAIKAMEIALEEARKMVASMKRASADRMREHARASRR